MSSPILAALTAATALAGAPATPAVHGYSGLTLSPAGDRVAAVEEAEPAARPPAARNAAADAPRASGDQPPTADDRARDRPHGVVTIRSARDGRVLQRLDPCTACGYAGLTFSPDGRELAFIASDTHKGTATLEAAQGAAVRTVAVVDGAAETPRWSPDGRMLAVLATPGARKAAGATQAGVPQVGEIGVSSDEQRLAVVPAAGGALRFVSPADTYVYEYGWTPDGRGFAATSAKGNGDDNWWVARLVAYTVDAAPERVIARPQPADELPARLARRALGALHRRADERLRLGGRRPLHRRLRGRRAPRHHPRLPRHLHLRRLDRRAAGRHSAAWSTRRRWWRSIPRAARRRGRFGRSRSPSPRPTGAPPSAPTARRPPSWRRTSSTRRASWPARSPRRAR